MNTKMAKSTKKAKMHEHEEEADEHVWLSLKNAEVLVGTISNALQEVDPGNKDAYAANADAYVKSCPLLMQSIKRL